jgi:divalent metal cation (Fe/Co/Zn/Cd) transporter
MAGSTRRLERRAALLEYGTLAWCAVEASVSIWLGVAAGSIALIAFGLDSGIEIFAALVVLWQLRGNNEERTGRASVTTLCGLALNATLGWWWADPAAGIVIALLAVKEGREAWLGDHQSASHWRE